ncbi:MAG: hypothetical protein GVX96_01740 [Bacteroidetes bacterium]|jgi:hypothetical protein|nr:hypothetical protein [Bacteroidota bacterium]
MAEFTRFLIVFFICLFGSIISGQIQLSDSLLRVEKVNSPKVIRFFPGEEIRIKPKDREWRWAVIESFDFENGLIFFNNGAEYADSLEALQTERQFSRARTVRNFLMVPGVLSAVVGGGQLIFGGVNGGFALTAGGVLIGGGILADFILRRRYYRFNKRWRVRLIDLSID